MAKPFEAYVDSNLQAGSGSLASRKRTRSVTRAEKNSGELCGTLRSASALTDVGNGVLRRQDVTKPNKRGVRGGSQRKSKRARVEKRKNDVCGVSTCESSGHARKHQGSAVVPAYKEDHLRRADEAMADLNTFVAENPDAFSDACDDSEFSVVPCDRNACAAPARSMAAMFFEIACEDVVERLMSALTLDACPMAMLVNKTWASKLRPRLTEFVPTRRVLHNLMKRQISVDAAFVQSITQEGGNSMGLTLRMHMILVDWLVDVAAEFRLGDATLALTAQIISRFLSVELVEKRELQLLGVTCMWIASKMEEVSVPLVTDFAWITYDTYTTAELRAMEHRVLRALNFRLSCITPWTLIHTVLEAPTIGQHSGLSQVTSFLHDLAIHDPAFSCERPAEVAAAIVYGALQATLPSHEVQKIRDAGTLECLLKCTSANVQPLLEAVVQLPKKARNLEQKLSAVLVKFRKDENGAVANRILV